MKDWLADNAHRLLFGVVVALLGLVCAVAYYDYKDTVARGCTHEVLPIQQKVEYITTWVSTGNGGGYVQVIPTIYTLYQCTDGTTKWR